MEDLKSKLKSRFQHDAYFMFLPTLYLGDIPVSLAGLSSLIDFPQTINLLSAQAQHSTKPGEDETAFIQSLGTVLQSEHPDQEAAKEVVKGSLLLFYEPAGLCIKVETKVPNVVSRSIETPSTENVLRGGMSGFNENLEINIGMIRKHMNTEELQNRSYSCGKQITSRLEVLYLENTVDPQFLKCVLDQIEANLDKDIADIQHARRMLGFPKMEFITKFNSTELPQNTAAALYKGKVVIMLERFPFALILPNQLSDMFALEDDNNFPYSFSLFLRIIRILGIFITLMLPGLYVALVSVNPEVLRIELALSIAKSRVDVPYPAFVETIILLIILELILEACIRLPKTIGPTLTMVGGIILGEAVVAAKLVSNLLIIILAATTIASSTVVGYQNSISLRIMKFAILFLCTFFGVLGLVAGLVLLIAYVAGVETFGVPYFKIKSFRGGKTSG